MFVGGTSCLPDPGCSGLGEKRKQILKNLSEATRSGDDGVGGAGARQEESSSSFIHPHRLVPSVWSGIHFTGQAGRDCLSWTEVVCIAGERVLPSHTPMMSHIFPLTVGDEGVVRLCCIDKCRQSDVFLCSERCKLQG